MNQSERKDTYKMENKTLYLSGKKNVWYILVTITITKQGPMRPYFPE